MFIRSLYAISVSLFLTLLPAFGQSDNLSGTWSGHWVPEGGGRDAVTVRFAVGRDDNSVTGEIVHPQGIHFDSVSFDSATGSLVAEAQSDELGHFRIDATIEEGTRLNGTLVHDNMTGEMKLTKWTYDPRIR